MKKFFQNKIVKTVEILIILAIVLYFTHQDIAGFLNSFRYGHFVNIPDMNIARAMHTATLMDDGRVLIVGGAETIDKEALRTAEIYDPKQNKFILVPNKTNVDHVGSKSFLLSNGKVVILNYNGIEIFDPKTNTFKLINKMLTPRYFFEAVKLKDDKILMCGGQNDTDTRYVPGKDNKIRNCEVYDQLKNNSFLVNTNDKAYFPSSWKQSPILLQDGRVIFIHRYSNLIYDPVQNKFTKQVIPAINEKYIGSAVMLDNNKILVIPEFDYSHIFDPYTNKVYQTINEKRDFIGVSHGPKTGGVCKTFLLKNRKVLITNDCKNVDVLVRNIYRKADLYDPESNKFLPLGSMNKGRYEYAATLLKNGNVLFTGGINFKGVISASIDKNVAKTAEIFITGK